MNNDWKDKGLCVGQDVNNYFDNYEEDLELREDIDVVCSMCPVMRTCFAVGVSTKQWGVWGGVYLENGKISREFNKHRSKADWAEKWQELTIDKE